MQRLLISHPDAFIWGENGGHLESLLAAAETLVARSDSLAGQAAREDFEAAGYQAFIANLIPSPDHIEGAFRGFVEQLYRRERVWGFKEVRHGLDFAKRLQRFFPDLKVVGLVRDPRDILSSIDEWETKGKWPRKSTEDVIASWLRVASSLMVTQDVPILTFRYEDYTADPQRTVELLGDFAGLDPAGFDMTVFDRRIHMHGKRGEGVRELRKWEELPADMRELLDSEEIRETANAFSYDLR